MSNGDELLDFNPDYTDAFLELTPVLLPARTGAPVAATAPGPAPPAATPAQSFPAVDPAASFCSVNSIMVVAGCGQPKALARGTAAAATDSLAAAASDAAAPPRSQDLSPLRASAGAVAGAAASRPQHRPQPPTTRTPLAADKASGPLGSANKTAPKTARTSDQAHAAHRRGLDFGAASDFRRSVFGTK